MLRTSGLLQRSNKLMFDLRSWSAGIATLERVVYDDGGLRVRLAGGEELTARPNLGPSAR